MVGKVSLKEIIGTAEEIDFVEAIKRFECQDKDVEKFLKEKSFDFEKRNKSRTYLLIDSERDEIAILGYYTLTMKSLPFEAGTSKSAIKTIDGFRADVSSAEAILIGQVGKDFKRRNRISGKSILDHAIGDVYKVQKIVGGRIVFLECSDIEKVVKFYRDNSSRSTAPIR